MEMINVKINKNLLDILEQLNKKRISDNIEKKTLGTRNPIYIVEDCRFIDCAPEDADVALLIPYCSSNVYSFEEIKKGAIQNDFDISDDVMESLKDATDLEEVKDILNSSKECEELVYSYTSYKRLTWEEKAMFLTHNEASEYLKYQSHNLSENSRIYVKSLGYDNRSIFPKLLDILQEEEIIIEREQQK